MGARAPLSRRPIRSKVKGCQTALSLLYYLYAFSVLGSIGRAPPTGVTGCVRLSAFEAALVGHPGNRRFTVSQFVSWGVALQTSLSSEPE